VEAPSPNGALRGSFHLTKEIPPRTVQKRTVNKVYSSTSILFNITQKANYKVCLFPALRVQEWNALSPRSIPAETCRKALSLLASVRGSMDVPPTSLESDVICAKSSGESDFPFFNCIIRKQEPSSAVIPRCPLAPGEGIAKCFRSIPVYMCAPGNCLERLSARLLTPICYKRRGRGPSFVR
jgi:hypothetical protein